MTARFLAPSVAFTLLAAFVVAGVVRSGASAQSPTQPQTRPDGSAQQENLVYVLMTTSKGDIVIELNREKAPISVENFLGYVDKKFYDGTIFHRVMKDFMVQGGGFTPDMKQKTPEKPIKNEWQNGLKNVRGTIAMARVGGNPDSATSQFFINVVDNAMLDQRQSDGAAYAVFGKVVAGMGTVETIRKVPVGPNPHNPREVSQPKETVTIEKVVRLSADEAKDRINKEKGAATQ